MSNSSTRGIVNIASFIPLINAGTITTDTLSSRVITTEEIIGNPTLDLTSTTSITVTSPSITFGNTSTAIEVAETGGGDPQLGFFGETPISQPTTAISALTFVANTSGISDDTATYGGYTIGQLAAALQGLGFLE